MATISTDERGDHHNHHHSRTGALGRLNRYGAYAEQVRCALETGVPRLFATVGWDCTTLIVAYIALDWDALRVGMNIDCLDLNYGGEELGSWSLARITDLRRDSNGNAQGIHSTTHVTHVTHVKVHYEGWSNSWDEWIPLADTFEKRSRITEPYSHPETWIHFVRNDTVRLCYPTTKLIAKVIQCTHLASCKRRLLLQYEDRDFGETRHLYVYYLALEYNNKTGDQQPCPCPFYSTQTSTQPAGTLMKMEATRPPTTLVTTMPNPPLSKGKAVSSSTLAPLRPPSRASWCRRQVLVIGAPPPLKRGRRRSSR